MGFKRCKGSSLLSLVRLSTTPEPTAAPEPTLGPTTTTLGPTTTTPSDQITSPPPTTPPPKPDTTTLPTTTTTKTTTLPSNDYDATTHDAFDPEFGEVHKHGIYSFKHI